MEHGMGDLWENGERAEQEGEAARDWQGIVPGGGAVTHGEIWSAGYWPAFQLN